MKVGGERILVIDAGTTGTRAAVFDLSGRLLGVAYREYKSQFLSPIAIDHDPATWLDAVGTTIPEVIQRTATKPESCLAVAVTGQRATVVPVGADGEPLAPAILWQDKRTMKQCHEIESRVGSDAVYARTGLRIDPYFSLPKLMWFHQERPDVYRTARFFLTVHDLIIHHLTGQFRTDWTQASRTMLFDIVRFQWDADLARACEFDRAKLPEALAPGSVAGRLTAATAARLGLPQGLPVVMAGGDQQAAAVGLGAIHQGVATATTGTGTFVIAPVEAPLWDPQRRVLLSASGSAGQWILEAGIFTSGAVYRWLREALACEGPTEATHERGDDPYEQLNTLAGQAPLGAGGVIVLPHFMGSAAPYWNPDARGVIFNLTLSHRTQHLARAVLEGMTIEIGKNLAIIETLLRGNGSATADPGLTEVRVTGGVTRSSLFNQIQADVYGCRVLPGKVTEATALGAAILAAVALGGHADVPSACEAMTGVDTERAQEPDPRRHAAYRQLTTLHDAIYRALAQGGIYEIAAAMPTLLM
jgi:glycerol kinase